jgi:hypothetical protein
MTQQPLVCQGLIFIEASRSHSDTPHSVELLWTSDRPVAETSTWQRTTLIRDRHRCPGGIQTRNPSKRAAADPRLKSPRRPEPAINKIRCTIIHKNNYVSYQAFAAVQLRSPFFWDMKPITGRLCSTFRDSVSVSNSKCWNVQCLRTLWPFQNWNRTLTRNVGYQLPSVFFKFM